jgi:glycine/D-amino acid oxidase-like deaminating enzyme
VSPPAHEDVDCIDPATELQYGADHHWWEEVIWPTLFHRVPAFGNVKVVSSWAGLYEYNTVDQNAIIDFHPEIPNLLLVNGFSGHGLQHSPAAGRAAAELLLHGRFQVLDLSVFSYDRIVGRSPTLLERGIV